MENDLNSINFFSNEYCANKFGNNYTSESIPVGINVAYNYCKKLDILDKYNFTVVEKECYKNFKLSYDYSYRENCVNLNLDYKAIAKEVDEYLYKTSILSSYLFIYQTINEEISQKIKEFEIKSYKFIKNQKLQANLLEATNLGSLEAEVELNKNLNLLTNKLSEQINILEAEEALNRAKQRVERKINLLISPLAEQLRALEAEEKLEKKINLLIGPLAEKLRALEVEEKLNKKINLLTNPMSEQVRILETKRNIDICRGYGFIEGSSEYFECLLVVIQASLSTLDQAILSTQVSD